VFVWSPVFDRNEEKRPWDDLVPFQSERLLEAILMHKWLKTYQEPAKAAKATAQSVKGHFIGRD
jgi:hypothetical protein